MVRFSLSTQKWDGNTPPSGAVSWRGEKRTMSKTIVILLSVIVGLLATFTLAIWILIAVYVGAP